MTRTIKKVLLKCTDQSKYNVCILVTFFLLRHAVTAVAAAMENQRSMQVNKHSFQSDLEIGLLILANRASPLEIACWFLFPLLLILLPKFFFLLSRYNSVERHRNKSNNNNNTKASFFNGYQLHAIVIWNFNFAFAFAWDRLVVIRFDSIFHNYFRSSWYLIYRRAMQIENNTQKKTPMFKWL